MNAAQAYIETQILVALSLKKGAIIHWTQWAESCLQYRSIKCCIEMFVHVVGKGQACTQPLSLQDLQESSSISAASHSQLPRRKLKMLGFSTGNPCPILLCVCDFFSATSMLSVGGWKGKQGTSNQIWENTFLRGSLKSLWKGRGQSSGNGHSQGGRTEDWVGKKRKSVWQWLGLFVSLMNVCVFSWIFAHRVSPRCCEPVVKACLFSPSWSHPQKERINTRKKNGWMNEWIKYWLRHGAETYSRTVRQCKRLANIITNA